jgi:CTP:molybdopterin cytidylyltransferase MocA
VSSARGDSGRKAARELQDSHGEPLDAILLAAGESRRMGFPKPLLKLDGRTFIETLAAAILKSASHLIVVVGAHGEAVRRAVPKNPRIKVVENPDYIRGQLSSIKAALPHVDPAAVAALVHLADHPMVHPETFKAVIDAYRRKHSPVTVARYRGRRGHPVVFAREIFSELAGASEDQGARAVLAADPSRVAYVEVDDPGILVDLDTPEDLRGAGIRLPGGNIQSKR